MKIVFKQAAIPLLIAVVVFLSCTKTETGRPASGGNQTTYAPPPPPPPPPPPGVTLPPPTEACDNRPEINATLVPIGNLSSGRIYPQCASAGNKILFIGGMHEGPNWWYEPVPADIYDISSNTLSTHLLLPPDARFTHFRDGAAIAAVGNKILFAGGGDGMGDNVTAQVDIFDVSTGSWSMTQLSDARQGLVAATVGDKVLFAGGFGYPNAPSWGYFNTVDIYDNASNTWSKATLSEARMNITATTVGSKIYFAGGRTDVSISKTIDIYDAATNSWSVSSLHNPRCGMGSIADNENIYWAGGALSFSPSIMNNNVEILNIGTGNVSDICLLGRMNFTAVKKDDNIIFFTGLVGTNDSRNGINFDIYNTTTHTWSIGKLNQKVFNAAVISVNNTIYVAGGSDGGTNYFNQLWKLEF